MTETTVRLSPVASAASPDDTKEYGILIGELAGFSADGAPLVAYEGNAVLVAQSLVDIGEEHIGRRIALQFQGGDPGLPLVMGVLRNAALAAGAESSVLAALPLSVRADDEEIVLLAQRRITLQCGAASITLDASGNVEIRGKHVLSRAAGQNRIKGSSVSLN